MLLRDFSVPFEHVKMIDPKFYSYSYTQPYFLPGRGSYYTTLAHIEEVKTTAFFWCAGWRQRRRLLSQSERLTYWGKERERGGREGAGREQGGSCLGVAVTQGENDLEIAPFLEKGRLRRRRSRLSPSATGTGYGGLIDCALISFVQTRRRTMIRHSIHEILFING